MPMLYENSLIKFDYIECPISITCCISIPSTRETMKQFIY